MPTRRFLGVHCISSSLTDSRPSHPQTTDYGPSQQRHACPNDTYTVTQDSANPPSCDSPYGAMHVAETSQGSSSVTNARLATVDIAGWGLRPAAPVGGDPWSGTLGAGAGARSGARAGLSPPARKVAETPLELVQRGGAGAAAPAVNLIAAH